MAPPPTDSMFRLATWEEMAPPPTDSMFRLTTWEEVTKCYYALNGHRSYSQEI